MHAHVLMHAVVRRVYAQEDYLCLAIIPCIYIFFHVLSVSSKLFFWKNI